MQAIFESIFDITYLALAIILGVKILGGAKGRKQFQLFGVMTVLLACGDAFHLVPRVWALNTNGVENHAGALGFGTLITSITMTIFYVILYHVWRLRYDIKNKTELTVIVYTLAVVRVILCLFPQNDWLSAYSPVSWGIYRNIPFSALGLMIIILFAQKTREHNDRAFRFMWLAITLSFTFYIPVVLWAGEIPMLGMLMLPKTVAYVWIIWMGYKDMKKI